MRGYIVAAYLLSEIDHKSVDHVFAPEPIFSGGDAQLQGLEIVSLDTEPENNVNCEKQDVKQFTIT
jgi:hypothetical protein